MQELNKFNGDAFLNEEGMDPIHVIHMGDTIAISQTERDPEGGSRLLDLVAGERQAIALRDFLIEAFPIDHK